MAAASYRVIVMQCRLADFGQLSLLFFHCFSLVSNIFVMY